MTEQETVIAPTGDDGAGAAVPDGEELDRAVDGPGVTLIPDIAPAGVSEEEALPSLFEGTVELSPEGERAFAEAGELTEEALRDVHSGEAPYRQAVNGYFDEDSAFDDVTPKEEGDEDGEDDGDEDEGDTFDPGPIELVAASLDTVDNAEGEEEETGLTSLVTNVSTPAPTSAREVDLLAAGTRAEDEADRLMGNAPEPPRRFGIGRISEHDDDACLKIAEVVHEAHRVYCRQLGDDSLPSFAEIGEAMLAPMIAGVKKVLCGRVNSAEQSHAAWMNHKLNDGWTYGPVKSFETLQHPNLVLFEALPVEQQVKDALFVGIVKAYAGLK